MKPRPHTDSTQCSQVSDMLGRIGDKWTVLVISTLGAQKACNDAQHAPTEQMRFSEIQRSIGNISQKMLTTTLRNLERDGFVTRTVTPTRPPRVDYALTDLGQELLVPVQAMAQWAVENAARIQAARAQYDGQSAA